MEHFAANPGRRPVELMAATLYPEGAPLSSPVETAAPTTGAGRRRVEPGRHQHPSTGGQPRGVAIERLGPIAQIPTRAIAAASVQSSTAPVMSGARPIAIVAIAARMSPARVAFPTLTSPAPSAGWRMYM